MNRLLVFAGTAVAEMAELPSSVRSLVDRAEHVFVVTPTLPSRLEWWVSDIDRARHEADARLDVILAQLRETDVAADGAVGDETPLTAVSDHIRAFEPDHLLIALRSAEHASWQERGLIDAVGREFRLPITVFEIDPDGSVRDPARP